MARYGSASFSLPRLIGVATRKLNTQYDVDRLVKFTREHPDHPVGAFVEAIETVKTNTRWMDINKKPVADWLNSKMNPEPEPVKNYRLPKDLKPSSYRLTVQHYFKPTIMPQNYTGRVEIDFECVQTTDKLVLHYNKLVLDMRSLTITSKDDALDFTITPKFETNYDPVTHFFKDLE